MINLISIESVVALGAIQKTLRKHESKAPNQRHLAVLTASIIVIDQAQSVPASQAVKTLDLAESYLGEIDQNGEYAKIRLDLILIARAERDALDKSRIETFRMAA